MAGEDSVRVGGVAGFASLIYVVKAAYRGFNEARRRHDTFACKRNAGIGLDRGQGSADKDGQEVDSVSGRM